jgi:acyl-CoA thioesterase FadM
MLIIKNLQFMIRKSGLKPASALNKGPRIVFAADMFDEAGEFICKSEITLAYVNKVNRKACFPPAIIKSKLLNLNS